MQYEIDRYLVKNSNVNQENEEIVHMIESIHLSVLNLEFVDLNLKRKGEEKTTTMSND